MTEIGATSESDADPTTSSRRLIVSAPGAESQVGGVFAVGEHDCELLDPLPTTGMTVSPDATCLARLTWDASQSGSLGLLIEPRGKVELTLDAGDVSAAKILDVLAKARMQP